MTEPKDSGPPTRRVLWHLLDVLILLLFGAAMAAWTWQGWADLLVDFGRELYVPWQVTQGKALYWNLAYFNGPLSPHLNAVWFALFGASVQTLAVANLVVLGLVTALLYYLLNLAGDRLSALIACLAFLTIFAFGQTTPLGNHNFVLPFSHEMTHGILLLLLGVACVAKSVQPGGSEIWEFGAGVCAGAAFLTAPEIILASLALPIGLWTVQLAWKEGGGSTPWSLSMFVAGALVPLAAAGLFLSQVIGVRAAMASLVRGWTVAFDYQVTALDFYRGTMGLDEPWHNLRAMAASFGSLLLLGFPALIALRAVEPEPGTARPMWVAFVRALPLLAGTAVTLMLLIVQPQGELGRALPLVLLFLLVWVLARRVGRGARATQVRKVVVQVTLLVLSLLLLANMVLEVRTYGDGFALAMPGTLMVVVAAAGWIPDAVQRRGRWGALARNWILGVLLAIGTTHVIVMSIRLGQKEYEIGSGPDIIRTDAVRGPLVDQAMAVAAANLQEGETLLALPEGASLNFFLRVPSPSRFMSLTPLEVMQFGEEEIVGSMWDEPPGVVLLVHSDTRQYGLGRFGEDYGAEMMEWVRSRYRTVEVIGDPPFQPGTRFGIEVLRRRGQ
jgi:hypothetical protein